MRPVLLAAVACGLAFAAVDALQPRRGEPSRGATYDLIVRNGRLLDGETHHGTLADLAVRAGRIAAIGTLAGARAARVLDAAQRFVTPGFIDTHSHAADGLARLGLQQGGPMLAQGVTTIVGNPDGGGPIDIAAQAAELARRGLGVNVALLVGHGSVRRAVMGMADRAPTAEELAEMQAHVRAAMEAGALGVSTGLFYAPGSYARTDEVSALVEVAGRFGGLHQSHIRDEGDYSVGLLASIDEVVRVAETTGTTGVISHLKALGSSSWGQAARAVARIEAARGRGVRLFADQYPYDASATSLAGALLPRWAQADGTDAMRRRLADPATRRRLLEDIRANIARRGGARGIAIAFYAPDREHEGRTLEQVAASLRLDPAEAVAHLLRGGDGSVVSFNMSEADVEVIMRQPWTLTASDGGLVFPTEGKPHPRSYGAFARKLERYVRARGTLTLEAAIRSMTSLPAAVFGLTDRGVLRTGAWADLAIFDPADVHETATYAEPHQLATGMACVVVNGVIVVENGVLRSALPGRVLRREPTGTAARR